MSSSYSIKFSCNHCIVYRNTTNQLCKWCILLAHLKDTTKFKQWWLIKKVFLWINFFWWQLKDFVMMYRGKKQYKSLLSDYSGNEQNFLISAFSIYNYNVVISVCPIITQKSLYRFASNFDWGPRETHGNVLSLVLRF